MVSEARLSVLLLTEDSGRNAVFALRALLERLLRRVTRGAEVGPHTWEGASEDVQPLMRGNGWKEAARHDVVRLRQLVAAKLREPRGFVFFHYDGDRRYRDKDTSENAAKFEALIRSPVRVILEGPPPRRREPARPSLTSFPDAASLLEKLIAIVPFYSVEAWYFQNTRKALALCQTNPGCRRACEAKLTAWEGDRRELDEVEKPKRELCFGDTRNLELARDSFPVEEVLAAEKSLHDLKRRFDECAALCEALAQTRPPWARG